MWFLFLSSGVYAQKMRETNLPHYDNKWIRYGFILGAHSSSYQMKYNEVFTSSQMDSVHSILPPNNFGFSIGFIVNFRLAQYLDFRVLPKVSFYESKLEFNYTNQTPTREAFIESTVVEFPLLLKYKSQRRFNNRMYVVGGVTPSLDASARKDDENMSKLQVKRGNLSVDLGFGIDIYYPLFKFSPEIRYSMGLVNMLKSDPNPYNMGVSRLTTNTITLYLQFE